jgi:hypothetical protein
MPCARQMLHLPTIHHSRQQRSIGHSLLCKIRLQSPSPRPEVSRKRMHPNGPDGQGKVLACIQAYHSEGTNLAKIASLGEPRASYTTCSIQAFWYQESRSNVIPRFRVLGKGPLLLAARSFHRIESTWPCLPVFARVRHFFSQAPPPSPPSAVQDPHLCDIPITFS